jgi:DNA-binding LacI/PurR family transcriptional regulator
MESSLPLDRQARRPDYQRIARELRDEIIKGRFATGTRLPSTEELALTWKSSVYTVHTALASLVKEGWIERIQGAGTYVAEPKNRFTCAGIYHEADIGSNRLSNFVRSIHDCLLEQFAAMKKETQIFIDSRPSEKRGVLLPAMLEAIQNRQIQCLIAPTATFKDSPALAGVNLPVAFAGNPGSSNRVDFDKAEFLREGVRRLARQGCHSVGMIVPHRARVPKPGSHDHPYQEAFLQIMREEGLATRPGWISDLHDDPTSYEAFGYLQFLKLWRQRKRPDGLIVYPDTVVRGVITGVLKLGLDDVVSQMKFVFHRNAHMNLLCPFPVTWGISDEEVLAAKLIQIIEKQFRGEKVSPILLPYEMQADDAARWR